MKVGSPDWWAIVLVVSVVVGGGVGLIIGRGKGRPGLGFVLGFVFGLLGWLVMAVLPRARTVTREQRPSRGWYPDPTGAHEMRYFDGMRWLDEVADRGEMSTDPVQLVGAHVVRVEDMPPPPLPSDAAPAAPAPVPSPR